MIQVPSYVPYKTSEYTTKNCFISTLQLTCPDKNKIPDQNQTLFQIRISIIRTRHSHDVSLSFIVHAQPDFCFKSILWIPRYCISPTKACFAIFGKACYKLVNVLTWLTLQTLHCENVHNCCPSFLLHFFSIANTITVSY